MRLRMRGRRSPALMAALLPMSMLVYAGLFVTAAVGVPLAYLALLVISLLLDLRLENAEPWVRTLVKTAHLHVAVRGALSASSFALLLVRDPSTRDGGEVAALAILAVAMPLARSAYLGLLGALRSRTTRGVLTRNVDLGPLADARALPAWMVNRVAPRLVLLGGGPLLGGAIGIVAGTVVPFAILASAYLLGLGAATVFLAARFARAMSFPRHDAGDAEALEVGRRLGRDTQADVDRRRLAGRDEGGGAGEQGVEDRAQGVDV